MLNLGPDTHNHIHIKLIYCNKYAEKLSLHDIIMQTANTDQNKLEFSTYEKVLNRLKLQDMKMYNVQAHHESGR